jgi:hypothetical protein
VLTYPNVNEINSADLSMLWLLDGIADEVKVVGSSALRPVGEPLYTRHLFNWWAEFRRVPHYRPLVFPQHITDYVDRTAGRLLGQDEFLTVQPLFDVRYDRHRNEKPNWWAEVITCLQRHYKTAVLCTEASGRALPHLPDGVVPLWNLGLNVAHSLAVMSKSAGHFGGETGLTLWAGVLQLPLAAAYRYWEPPWPKNAARGMDTRPAGAGAPVVCVPLGCDPQAAADSLLSTIGKVEACVA